MVILLDALSVPGFLLGHGGNLDFLAFHVLADVENCGLS